MLNWIVSHSLRFRGVVIALAAAVIAYGTFIAARTPFDVFPEFAPPMVVIQTEAPGLLAEQVEALVTRPLEAALNGTPHLAGIRSESIQGLSVRCQHPGSHRGHRAGAGGDETTSGRRRHRLAAGPLSRASPSGRSSTAPALPT